MSNPIKPTRIIIADKRFTTAYSMIDRNAVYYQDDNLNELDMMFSIARMTTEEMWRTRSGLAELRQAMNVRATGIDMLKMMG